MRFSVLLTDDAARDLEELHDHIRLHDGLRRAVHVVARIEKAFNSLSAFLRRGAYAKEFLAPGIREHREILFKPHRIIYRIIEDKVSVLLIADGRRDMQTLLQGRLLKQ